MVNIFIWMEHVIKDNGKMINNMVKVLKNGQMEQFMRVNMKLEKNMVKEFLNGLMVQCINI